MANVLGQGGYVEGAERTMEQLANGQWVRKRPPWPDGATWREVAFGIVDVYVAQDRFYVATTRAHARLVGSWVTPFVERLTEATNAAVVALRVLAHEKSQPCIEVCAASLADAAHELLVAAEGLDAGGPINEMEQLRALGARRLRDSLMRDLDLHRGVAAKAERDAFFVTLENVANHHSDDPGRRAAAVFVMFLSHSTTRVRMFGAALSRDTDAPSMRDRLTMLLHDARRHRSAHDAIRECFALFGLRHEWDRYVDRKSARHVRKVRANRTRTS